MPISIAIDGHSGSGKSTLAKQLSQALGFMYLDTGALYRAVTLKVLTTCDESVTESSLKKLLKTTKVRIEQSSSGNRIFLDGYDVTDEIREPRVSDFVSRVSAEPIVREFLVTLQRKSARGKNVVLEGRDIGTVVLPDAQFKFFVTADLKERARRRWEELKQKGITISLEEVEINLKKRDKEDSSRKTSPLRKAPGAIVIDSSNMKPDEKLDIVLKIIRKKQWEQKNIGYTIYRAILLFLAKLLFRVKFYYEDYESVRNFGGLIVSNHASNIDPPIVGCGLPFHINFFTKESLLKFRLAQIIMKPCNLIPINREEPTPGSIKQVFELLRSLKPIILFPEGTRSPDGLIKEAKAGVGLIAYKSMAPILPAYICGSYQALPKGAFFPRIKQVSVYYGKPFFLDPASFANTPRKELYQAVSNLLLDRVKELRDKNNLPK